jgi:hypothetical protein
MMTMSEISKSVCAAVVGDGPTLATSLPYQGGAGGRLLAAP